MALFGRANCVMCVFSGKQRSKKSASANNVCLGRPVCLVWCCLDIAERLQILEEVPLTHVFPATLQISQFTNSPDQQNRDTVCVQSDGDKTACPSFHMSGFLVYLPLSCLPISEEAVNRRHSKVSGKGFGLV